MGRPGRLNQNRAGKYLRGSNFAVNLPEPVIINEPREYCLESREQRIAFQLKNIIPDERANVEGVHVQRIGSKLHNTYFVVNYSGQDTLESAVERICRIIDNRKR